jgi:phage terminase small subunit
MTPKQQRFVDEYLIDLNAMKAAIRAGYSANTARQIGEENLSKPDIAHAVARAMAERSKRTKVDADWVLRRLADEAEADFADL